MVIQIIKISNYLRKTEGIKENQTWNWWAKKKKFRTTERDFKIVKWFLWVLCVNLYSSYNFDND